MSGRQARFARCSGRPLSGVLFAATLALSAASNAQSLTAACPTQCGHLGRVGRPSAIRLMHADVVVRCSRLGPLRFTRCLVRESRLLVPCIRSAEEISYLLGHLHRMKSALTRLRRILSEDEHRERQHDLDAWGRCLSQAAERFAPTP